jgi:hypothetical protein
MMDGLLQIVEFCRRIGCGLYLSTNKDVMFLYRAVGDREFYSTMQTGRFSCLPGGVGVKYFGLDFADTLGFADKIVNRNTVAVLEIEAIREVVQRIGDFVCVDPFLFKHGTVEIWESDLVAFTMLLYK